VPKVNKINAEGWVFRVILKSFRRLNKSVQLLSESVFMMGRNMQYYLWRPNLKDEGDNFLIELAIAGNAAIIVTNNVKDLHSAELVFDNLRVCKPEQILREVN
jgi:predicted nucleic acid-binding protein